MIIKNRQIINNIPKFSQPAIQQNIVNRKIAQPASILKLSIFLVNVKKAFN